MILLDTHAWLWLRSDPALLPDAVLEILHRDRLTVSAISCWEVSTLVRLGRIALDRDSLTWVTQALEAEPVITALDVPPRVAVAAGALDATFPGDPADRIIYATSRTFGCRLVTKDRRLRAFAPQETVWD